MRGYAIAAGRAVNRVEVSIDNARTWQRAEIEGHGGEPWAWALWTTRLDLPAGEQEIIARAWDDAAQTQPERPDDVWNAKGYVNSAWHRIRVRAG